MAKTNSKIQVCEACSADVRPGSLYCYNCGGPVAPESKKAQRQVAKTALSNAWFKDELAEVPKRETTKLDEAAVPHAPEPEPAEAKPADTPIPKPGIIEDARLRSAANLRRRGKSIERRSVEVVWERPESSPDGRFIVAALVLTLFVVLIYLAASYLR
jgi:hypothetical protein